MTDVVCTVARDVWLCWLAEGTLPGEEEAAEPWAMYYGSGASRRKPSPPKDLQPGDRVYVAAFGFVRGYAPLLRIEPTTNGYALVRGAGAVAVTPWGERGPIPLPGFQGVRYRSWRRDQERPFPDWMTLGLPAKLRADVERFQHLRKDPKARAEMSRRALSSTTDPRRLFFGLTTLAAITLVLGLLGCRARAPAAEEKVERAPASAAAPPLPPAPPPCIRKACADRPRFLQCVGVATGVGQRSDHCGRWEIEYEFHCDCDRWEPVPVADGGTR
jgi:hypothetical protein